MENQKPANTNGFWKSLGEKYQSEESQKGAEKEFLSSPFASEDGSDGLARRDFLKLMGASMALAGTACVRRPAQYIVPYAEQPPEITPGVPNYYASSWVHQGEGYGFIVKTREGRPIKLEGNPNHPVNKNGLSARAQAQILSLYDPDRLQAPLKNVNGTYSKATWDEIDTAVQNSLKAGQNLFILSSSLASPTTQTMIADFYTAFKGQHVMWDVLGADDVVEGQKASYGTNVVPRFRFDKAKMIVSIDADFLGTWLSPTEYAKQFAVNRKPGPDMNKLVVFESMMSLTGANADTRIQIAPSQQLSAVMSILHELIVGLKVSRYSGDIGVIKTLAQYNNSYQEMGIEKELISQIAKDLWDNKGNSLVVAGGITTRTKESKELQIAVNFLNTILENEGKSVDGTNVTQTSYQGSQGALNNLIDQMNKGAVDALIIHKLNPVYALPASSGFKEALKKVKLVVYTGDRLDETGKLANFVAPDHHHLENWGDNEIQKGVFAIQQPTIRPLYDTRSLELGLISWAYQLGKGPTRLKDTDSWYEYLHSNWKNNLKAKESIAGDFDEFWLNFLKTGVVDTSSRSGKRNSNGTERKFLLNAFTSIQKKNTSDAIELVLYPKIGHMDGSFANVAWLQEFPDPITRLTWENYLNVSVDMAKTLKLTEGQIVEVSVGETKVKVPAHIQPGLHSKTVALAVGFGRTDAGSLGSNLGGNAFQLVQYNNGMPVFAALDVKLNPTSETTSLATIQEHHSMEGRAIIIQATLKEYLKNPNTHIEKPNDLSLWPKHEYKGYRWAMVIDQNSCNGCGACVIACQSENNIPNVGKKYVLQGRIMHWLRIDRYYSGSDAAPDTTTFQAVLCQQCENAPCETVCPVLATVHDDEGLNQMTYNRCVGTRYCSNNCPYKVRRFNWFNYETPLKKPQTLALNPDVTVRSRGVMEKCTFCVQRLHEAKNIAKDKLTVVKDGDVQTACQESCPTNAIVFGNFNDKDSEVSKEFKNPRSYSLLEELNTLPMVRYQTRIKNTDRIASDTHKEEGASHE